MTTFADGIFQFGGLPVGNGTIPTTFGNVYFVDAVNGVNTGSGSSPTGAWKTVEYAYSRVKNNNDDIIAIRGGSTDNVLSASLAVTNSRVHFIGLDGAWRQYGQGAKLSITASSGATNIAAIINTGTRNTFSNLKVISNSVVAQGLYALAEGGEYAQYSNCEFYLSSHLDLTTAAHAVVNGDSAQFANCTFGSLADAITATSLHPALLLTKNIVTASSVSRDVKFSDCLFWTQAVNTANSLVYSGGAADVERMMLFKRCGFINNKIAGAVPAQAIACASSLTVGQIILDPECFGANVTKLSTSTGVIVTGAAPSSGTGIGVNAA
jgi:hypothetical protein